MIVRTMFIKELQDAVIIARFLFTMRKLNLCAYQMKRKHIGGAFEESVVMVWTER